MSHFDFVCWSQNHTICTLSALDYLCKEYYEVLCLDELYYADVNISDRYQSKLLSKGLLLCCISISSYVFLPFHQIDYLPSILCNYINWILYWNCFSFEPLFLRYHNNKTLQCFNDPLHYLSLFLTCFVLIICNQYTLLSSLHISLCLSKLQILLQTLLSLLHSFVWNIFCLVIEFCKFLSIYLTIKEHKSFLWPENITKLLSFFYLLLILKIQLVIFLMYFQTSFQFLWWTYRNPLIIFN
jgi:hypothetical protein